MQSRLATTTAARSYWVLSTTRNRFLHREFAAAASSGRTADPAIYSGEVEKGPDVHYKEPLGGSSNEDKAAEATERELKNKKADNDPLVVPPKPPHVSSPRLESYGVNQPLNPIVQQKRQNRTDDAAPPPLLDEVICAAVDDTSSSKDDEERDEIESDEKYFSHHKASPLSEIEFADTRKPITQATDDSRGVLAIGYDDVGTNVIGWRPEQLDTAEEALRRGAEIFKQNAMRGDPESFPHSRVLRELRGEWF